MPRLALAPALAALLVAVACAPSPSAQLEANKAVVRRFTDAVNAAEWDALTPIVATDFSRHSTATPGPPVTSREGFIELQKSFLATFPDQRVAIQQLIAEGAYVAARATYTGTQEGPMGEFPATGKRVETPFLAVFRIDAGRIVEVWVEWDNIAMLTQLGLFPPPA